MLVRTFKSLVRFADEQPALYGFSLLCIMAIASASCGLLAAALLSPYR